MKGKEKQIEEMSKETRNKQWQKRDEYCLRIQKAMQYKGNCDHEDVPSILVDYEEEIKKELISEDSVVLSREEFELLTDIKDLQQQVQDSLSNMSEDIERIEKQARKETAEKILDFIQENRHKYEMWYLVSELRKFFGIEQNNDWVFGDLADELNNKFGVEIKE